MSKFRLNKNFIRRFKRLKPKFGYNGLGDFVYRRTYSRIDPKTNKKEQWADTVQRVVEGVYQMQLDHFHTSGNIKQYDTNKASRSAHKMYGLIWNMKFLPPGRGLWSMGTDIINKRKLYSALNNCAFVSTQDIDQDPGKIFEFVMDTLMLGVGVGFDCRGSLKGIRVQDPKNSSSSILFEIDDTRESWAQSTALLIESYLKPNSPRYEFSYSKIRPSGLPLKTFGGVSSGPESLKDLHNHINYIFKINNNRVVDSKLITDIMNLIGRCVVAGNVRRSSEIALSSADDEEFIHLKDYDRFPYRKKWGWCSNNSIIADANTNYSLIAKKIRVNGEPGVFWLDNARKYSRMVDPPDNKDHRVMGVNPCGEQSLESFEMCNLVEIFLNRIENKKDYMNTIKYAFLYAKTVTLGLPDWYETAEVMKRNRRIGLSLSSISEFYEREGENETVEWFNSGYKEVQKWDSVYSKLYNIPKSIKTTTVKPSGTISLLAGSTPGIHYSPGHKYHIRRVQISDNDPNLSPIIEAGYRVEKSIYTPNTSVIEFPIKLDDHIKSQDDVSIEHQFHMAGLAQRYWSDNQVSCTVSFSKKESHKIEKLLKDNKDKLKSISLLPRSKDGVYKQMPYEKISEKEYQNRIKNIKSINWDGDDKVEHNDAVVEKYCTSDGCLI